MMKKRMLTTLTQKQKRLLVLISENISPQNTGKVKTLKEMAMLAGYSRTMSETPARILKSPLFKEELQDLLTSLDSVRRSALSHITETKLEKAPPEKLAQIVDIMTKNHQLLSGGRTAETPMPILNVVNITAQSPQSDVLPTGDVPKGHKDIETTESQSLTEAEK